MFCRKLSFGAPEFGKGISKLKQPLVGESSKGDISCSDNKIGVIIYKLHP